MASTKDWIVAARLRTLPLSFASIFAGSAIALGLPDFDWLIFGLTLFVTLLLQILSNFANDYGDAQHGADHDGRLGPDRMVSQGIITRGEMKGGIILFSILSFLAGIFLLYISFNGQILSGAMPLLILGILAIISAIRYTVGKNPYGYKGQGDFYVFVFFGIVAVLGTKYLQTKSLMAIDLLPACAFGFWSAGVLNVNNMRDIISDKQAGKKTIPVIIGFKKAKVYHTLLIILGQVALIIYSSIKSMHYLEWVFALIFPVFWLHLLRVWRTEENHRLDPQLKVLALSSFFVSLVFFATSL